MKLIFSYLALFCLAISTFTSSEAAGYESQSMQLDNPSTSLVLASESAVSEDEETETDGIINAAIADTSPALVATLITTILDFNQSVFSNYSIRAPPTSLFS